MEVMEPPMKRKNRHKVDKCDKNFLANYMSNKFAEYFRQRPEKIAKKYLRACAKKLQVSSNIAAYQPFQLEVPEDFEVFYQSDPYSGYCRQCWLTYYNEDYTWTEEMEYPPTFSEDENTVLVRLAKEVLQMEKISKPGLFIWCYNS